MHTLRTPKRSDSGQWLGLTQVNGQVLSFGLWFRDPKISFVPINT